MNDTRDHELSQIYREGAWPEPSRQLDEAILEASRRAARARRSRSLAWRFGPPFALAATVVLTFAWVFRAYEEQPEILTAPAVRQSPETNAAPAAAPRFEEAKPATEPPAAAPAASALAAKKEAPPAPRADRLERLSEPPAVPAAREAAAPARAPQAPMEKASAPRLETAPAPMNAPQSTATAPAPAGAVASGVAAGAAAPAADVLRGDPQAWLEEIRKLKAQGKSDDVERQLADFRKRYPDYPLPDDLR